MPEHPNSQRGQGQRGSKASGQSKGKKATPSRRSKRSRPAVKGLNVLKPLLALLPSQRRIQYEFSKLQYQISHIRLPSLPRLRLPKVNRAITQNFKLPTISPPLALKGLGLDQRELLAIKCRVAFKILLVVYLCIVAFPIFPPQFSNAGWYVNAITRMIDAGTILLLALLAGNLSLILNSISQAAQDHAKFLLLASRVMTISFFMLIIAQIAASGFLVQQVQAGNRAQIRNLQRQTAPVVSLISKTSSPEQLNAIYQNLARNPNIPNSFVTQSPASKRASLLNIIESGIKSVDLQLRKQSRAQFVGLAINTARNIAITIAFCIGFQAFAQWSRVEP
jgi:hypothetical protein